MPPPRGNRMVQSCVHQRKAACPLSLLSSLLLSFPSLPSPLLPSPLLPSPHLTLPSFPSLLFSFLPSFFRFTLPSSFLCSSTAFSCVGKGEFFNGSIYFPPFPIMQIISLKKNRNYRQTKRKKFHHPQITITNIFMFLSLYLLGAVHQWAKHCCRQELPGSHTYWLSDLEQVT